MSRHGAQVIE